MANRVVHGALPGGGFGLRVSRPGYNVLDAGLTGKQLAFDSRWGAAARLFLNGKVTLSSVFPVAYHTVSFGATFASVPPVIIMQRLTSGASWQLVDGSLNNTWLPSGGIYEPARVYSDRLEIMRPFTGGEREFCYLVMRPLQ